MLLDERNKTHADQQRRVELLRMTVLKNIHFAVFIVLKLFFYIFNSFRFQCPRVPCCPRLFATFGKYGKPRQYQNIHKGKQHGRKNPHCCTVECFKPLPYCTKKRGHKYSVYFALSAPRIMRKSPEGVDSPAGSGLTVSPNCVASCEA